MRKTFVVPALLLLALPLTGCNKFKARVELKEGNQYYQEEHYQAALNQYKKGLELDPDATFAWRSAGMSALALYKPGDSSEKNLALGQEALTAFENYLADYPDDTKVRDFLMGLYIDAKKYDQALAFADRQLAANPNNVELYNYKLRVLIAQDKFNQAWQLAQNHRGEKQAEVLYTIGAAAWSKSFNDANLSLETRTATVDIGMQALEKALQLQPDYIEANTYYNLLLREKAKLTTDANERATLIAKAEEYRLKAAALVKAQLEKEKAVAAQAAPQPET